MKSLRSPRSFVSVAVVAASVGVLTGCGAAAPGASELAIEVIDSMVGNETISESVAVCMRAEVEEFGEEALDEMASLANDGDTRGIEGMEDFQAALAGCK